MRVVERGDDELGADVGHRAPEDAQAQRIGRGARGLDAEARRHQFLGRLVLAVEDRQVARGVIGALRRDHHGNAGHLDHARVVGADALLLDHGNAGDLVMRADARGALREQAAALVAPAHVLQRLQHELDVAERAQARFHQHAQRGADLDGIDAEIVGDGVHPRHVVRVRRGRSCCPSGRGSRIPAATRAPCRSRRRRRCCIRSCSPACRRARSARRGSEFSSRM